LEVVSTIKKQLDEKSGGHGQETLLVLDQYDYYRLWGTYVPEVITLKRTCASSRLNLLRWRNSRCFSSSYNFSSSSTWPKFVRCLTHHYERREEEQQKWKYDPSRKKRQSTLSMCMYIQLDSRKDDFTPNRWAQSRKKTPILLLPLGLKAGSLEDSWEMIQYEHMEW